MREKFGWGREELSAQKNLYAERIGHERNLQLFGEERFSSPPDKRVSEIEKDLLETMPFDKGWDFRFAERIVYGKELKRGPQNIGNCVGYSHCLLLATKIAHEILVEGDLEDVLGDQTTSPIPYIPYSYGAGRCLSGNMCGRGDGSYCSVQLRASMEHGFLPSDLSGLPTPVPQGTASTGRKFGSSKSTLNKWRKYALDFDLEHSVKIESEDELWVHIVQKKQPAQICSSWGFRATGTQIDINGWKFWVHKRSGSWAHSMQILAAFEDPRSGERYYLIGNQWGDYHKDGYWFVVPSSVMRSWIKASDTRTIGEISGRPINLGFAA